MNRDEAYTQLNDEIKERVAQAEQKALELLYKKKAHVEQEYEVRKDLSFAKVEPIFEYENDPVYLEHLKRGLKISVEEELINIQHSIDTILNNIRERELNDLVDKVRD